jgi:hypothetical protein
MERLIWTERQFNAGLPAGMLPFYLERLEGTIARLEKKVRDIPDTVLSHKLNGKWSIKQNIGHLAEVDEIGLKRIDEILTGAPIMSSAVFETKQDYNAQPVQQVIDYFKDVRLRKNKRFESLTEAELARTSLHPRLKIMMSPVDLAGFEAEHDDHHLVTINEILKSLR